jgi:hypothetical protein
VNGKTGFSPFPGNINQIVLHLKPYALQLEATGGVIAEFVNPKYKDAARAAFKKPTRLECMMQDYPKALPEGEVAGFTTLREVRIPPGLGGRMRLRRVRSDQRLSMQRQLAPAPASHSSATLCSSGM